jgi:hypothetical protein
MLRCLSLVVAVSGIALACDPGIEDPADAEPTPRPFVLLGTLRDEGGLAVSGATVGVAGDSVPWQYSISNDSGHFGFTGVLGPVAVRVWKYGFEHYVQNLVVAADVSLDIGLVKVEAIDSIRLGRTIRSHVDGNADPCDPIRWDTRAPCRRFSFTAPRSGTLVISVRWSGGSPLDAVILAPEGTYLAISEETGLEEATVSARVQAGATYEVRVNSYYAGQVFDLRADLQEGSGP